MRRSTRNLTSVSEKPDPLRVLKGIDFDYHIQEKLTQNERRARREATTAVELFEKTNAEYRRLIAAARKARDAEDEAEKALKKEFQDTKARLGIQIGIYGLTPKLLIEVKAFIKKWAGVSL